MSAIGLGYLRQWEGRTEQASDIVTLAPAQALLATLDHDPFQLNMGDILPPLFHWLYFLPIVRSSNIGTDGHPRKGGFLPPTPLPKRMFAGAKMQFEGAITIGDSLARKSTILSVQHKMGRSGELLFVEVEHVIEGTSGRIVEVQDIVYRDASASPNESPTARTEPALEGAISKTVTPDPVMLFRFSALTFNSHRIHFDREYAASTEHYPERVIHGPLVAVLLMDFLRRQKRGGPPTSFSFQGRQPVFVNRKLKLDYANQNGKAALRAVNDRGEVGMMANAEFS